MRWQQFTGPIMAKAFEDTFLYLFNPLISLNEVGGDPRPSTAPVADFPGYVRSRQKDWPDAMNASTTHDTKRGEDIRARVTVLSEIPAEWQKRLDRWAKLNARHRKTIDGAPVPDRNEEIFLYETLLGAWPFDGDTASFVGRLKEYAIKATREAMVHTRWTRPNLKHEQALERFISAILKAGANNKFLSDFTEFQTQIAFYGMANGLAQTLLKIAAPGVPDFYQGSDLWDFRLVDPDNRRPVDFEERKQALTKLRALDEASASPSYVEVARNWRDGSIKLYVIWKTLQQRAQHPDLYSTGEFLTLDVRGKRAGHVAAFARRLQKSWALIVVPRWLARAEFPLPPQGSGNFWRDTALQLPKGTPTEWTNVFTNSVVKVERKSGGRSIRMNELAQFPVALLTADVSRRPA